MNTRLLLAAIAAIATPSSAQWQTAKTTRYWDCCKPSCAWPNNANKLGSVNAAVKTCSRDGSYLTDQNSKNICSGGGTNNGPAYSCVDQQPWEVTSTVAYGFAAANLPCSVCYEMRFTSTSLSSSNKRMVLQVTNSGSDLGDVHFDIQLPGGGFGIFNGCSGQAPNGQGQFNQPESAWGARYGGVSSISACSGLPSELRSGCEFRFGWFENADNPAAEVRRVRCPNAIIDITGSRRDDDNNYPEVPIGGTSPPVGSPSTPQPTPRVTLPPTPSVCVPTDSSKCDCSWANAGSCGTDDGSECNCMCCCPLTGSCNYNGGGGGGGGGGGSCSMPPGIPSNPASVNNRDFVACHGKLSLGGSSGLQLVDENGEAVQLMGMSSHGLHWFPDCYTKESITFLVENWGINLFRAAMYIGENGYASNPSHKDVVKDIVRWCKELGIYVMIDWHILSPGNPNAATYSGADDFWREMATLYKDEKHVLYEVANEPNGVNWSEVKQYHDRIIDIIRVVDSETIIICGTPTWSQEIDQAAGNPVAKPYNVMYTFHFYAGSHTSLLGRVEQYASQIPIFVTEWGTSQANGDGGPYLTEAMQFLDLFASAGSAKVSLSFAQWSYADKNEVSAALTSGACGSKSWDSTSCSGTFLKNYIKSKVAICTAPQTSAPSTQAPTLPTAVPTRAPILPTAVPTRAPTLPTAVPTRAPILPTAVPTRAPTLPTAVPTRAPILPTAVPTRAPILPTAVPTRAPTLPTAVPTRAPILPTAVPTRSPAATTDAPVLTRTPSVMCSEWDACTVTPNCCPAGTRCLKKNDHYSQCRISCPTSGWDCSLITNVPIPMTVQPTAVPTESPVMKTSIPASDSPVQSTTAPRVTSVPLTVTDAPIVVTDTPTQPTAGPQRMTSSPSRTPIVTNVPIRQTTVPTSTDSPIHPTTVPSDAPMPTCREWDACRVTPSCCPSGTQCFKRNDHYSQCRVNCPSGWVCSSDSPTPATLTPGNNNPCAELIGKWTGCIASPYCCDVGLKCFEKNTHYAQCLPTCDSSQGWSCRDLGLSKDSSELGDAGRNAPKCACQDWQTEDVYCTDNSVCSVIPRSGTCLTGNTKCFGNSIAAENARRVISFVLKQGVNNFDEDAFKLMVKKSLQDETAVILVKYLCPASNCPNGRCNDPFGTASTCLSNYDLANRSLRVLQEDTEGSVVGFEIEGDDEGLQEAYIKKSLPGVIFANDRWEPSGYDNTEVVPKEDNKSLSLGVIVGIIFGSLTCLLIVIAATVLIRRRGAQEPVCESLVSFSSPTNAESSLEEVTYTTHTV